MWEGLNPRKVIHEGLDPPLQFLEQPAVVLSPDLQPQHLLLEVGVPVSKHICPVSHFARHVSPKKAFSDFHFGTTSFTLLMNPIPPLVFWSFMKILISLNCCFVLTRSHHFRCHFIQEYPNPCVYTHMQRYIKEVIKYYLTFLGPHSPPSAPPHLQAPPPPLGQ